MTAATIGWNELLYAHQCLRMNYVQDDEAMQKGIAIIAEEVKKAYAEQ